LSSPKADTLRLAITPQKDKWVELEAILTTTADIALALEVNWLTAEDSRPRALALRRTLLPWARPPEAGPTVEPERVIPEISGGNWLRGQKMFFSDQASSRVTRFQFP
jgi:hypothetical protein